MTTQGFWGSCGYVHAHEKHQKAARLDKRIRTPEPLSLSTIYMYGRTAVFLRVTEMRQGFLFTCQNP